ncbi:MAG: hypothetical protein C0462_05460 [Alcanivorax sp.]|nr:hypothetical protein [Alcanivorax sp.]
MRFGLRGRLRLCSGGLPGRRARLVDHNAAGVRVKAEAGLVLACGLGLLRRFRFRLWLRLWFGLRLRTRLRRGSRLGSGRGFYGLTGIVQLTHLTGGRIELELWTARGRLCIEFFDGGEFVHDLRAGHHRRHAGRMVRYSMQGVFVLEVHREVIVHPAADRGLTDRRPTRVGLAKGAFHLSLGHATLGHGLRQCAAPGQAQKEGRQDTACCCSHPDSPTKFL